MLNIFKSKKKEDLELRLEIVEEKCKKQEERIAILEGYIQPLIDDVKRRKVNVDVEKTKKWLNSYPDETGAKK